MLANSVLEDSPMSYDLESKFPTLPKAPITEALIDIRAELPPGVDLAELRRFYAELEGRFPRIEERFAMSATVELNQQGAQVKDESSHPDGFVMRSEADGSVVQVRLDGFTMHKLHPYISWQSLSGQARELWRRYVSVARPSKVVRLAVRYTNRIEVAPGQDFKQFVLTAPEIAPGIPQMLPEYLMRLVIPHPAGSTAIVTMSSLPPVMNSATVSMLFDIDAFRLVDISAVDEESIWSFLDELRAYKNLIFFNSITPSQLEKYQ
jgi:uncharacterized protein (TIGR04255 family)